MICDTMSSYLSMSNLCVKTHNRFLPEAQPRNLLAVDKLSDKTTKAHQLTENNNHEISPHGNDKLVRQVWSKYSFQTNSFGVKSFGSDEAAIKMSWADTTPPDQEDVEDVETPSSAAVAEDDEPTTDKDVEVASPPVVDESRDEEASGAAASPAHHARRPMNAFLIFCKKHRPIVRDRYPNLENRGVTKILGEWWALLEQTDKAPYTELAKEYKDAFLSANPNFKWYKLPAPPLRTLNVRPTVNNKAPSPVSSPTHCESEFTPGKLADESQLGSLTSLLNNNYTTSSSMKTSSSSSSPLESETNNNLCCDSINCSSSSSPTSPVNLIKTSLPPKPIKKRIFEKYLDNNNKQHVARNLLEDISEASIEKQQNDDVTTKNQDLVDSVVDEMYRINHHHHHHHHHPHQTEDYYDPNVRKSGRQCKGKLYEKFMVEGKLLGNKRDAKLTSQKLSAEEAEPNKTETETPNLNYTIKRLAERTNMKNLIEHQDAGTKPDEERTRTTSETSDSSGNGKPNSNNNNFNLDLRISELNSLSYDVFSQRKRDSKKRKNRIRTDGGVIEAKKPKLVVENQPVVGSKKRKNKQSITHLEKKDDDDITSFLGLATLAEVAAQTQKIDEQEKISE